jgi:hypothetical protein
MLPSQAPDIGSGRLPAAFEINPEHLNLSCGGGVVKAKKNAAQVMDGVKIDHNPACA